MLRGAAATGGGGGRCTCVDLSDGVGLCRRRLDVDEFRRRHVGFDFFELGRRRRRLVDVLGLVDLRNFDRRNNRLHQLAGQPGVKCPNDDHVEKDDGNEGSASPARK